MERNLDHIHIVSAAYLQDYVIRFAFSDGKIHDLDFYPFLGKVSQNPMTSKYLNVELFKKFETTPFGDISWNNGEMCYGFFTLYYGFEKDVIQEARYYKKAPVIRLTSPLRKQKKIIA